MPSLPILYTFRRCPYAMRARFALAIAGVACEVREIQLRHKPDAFLACSPKGTVPVLQQASGAVLEESLDIVCWAIALPSAAAWRLSDRQHKDALAWVADCDSQLKPHLDAYKYPDRYPERSADTAKAAAWAILQRWSDQAIGPYCFGDKPSWLDLALFPFVRQLVAVDTDTPPALPAFFTPWLTRIGESLLFADVMTRWPVWGPEALAEPQIWVPSVKHAAVIL